MYKWLIVFCCLTSCAKRRAEPTIGKNPFNDVYMQFEKQGHRGCRGLMPENTIPAMYRALELGVTTLEMDVVITADGHVLVSHEPWMGHEIATHPGGAPVTEAEARSLNIYRMTYEETTRYDVGMRPHPRFPQQQKIAVHKPLLAHLLDSVIAYCRVKNRSLPFFNIETKCLPAGDGIFHPAPGVFAEKLEAVIKEKKVEQHTTIQSFDFRTLQYIHQEYPGIRTAMLVEDYDRRTPQQLLDALGYTPDYYSPHFSLVNPELVAFCKEHKMKLVPWTVNDKQKIDSLTKMGVNGIITDYPNLFNQ